jgi:hypothetical protein
LPQSKKAPAYAENVFINCPFDKEYTPLFEAIVFTIIICGFRPQCARQRVDSAEVRLDKLDDLIRASRYSIHDLSRTTPDAATGNPRFNMPFELGLDIGCRRFGRGYEDKCALIFASEKYEYQKFLSDIAGQDIENHHLEVAKVIRGVRNFLAPHRPSPPPGATHIKRRYETFRAVLPDILSEAGIESDEMEFSDLTWAVVHWVETLE